jgi:hypothetical protein
LESIQADFDDDDDANHEDELEAEKVQACKVAVSSGTSKY